MSTSSLSAASAGYIMMMITQVLYRVTFIYVCTYCLFQFIWIFLFGVQHDVSILRSFNDLNSRVYDTNAFNFQKGGAHYSLPTSNNNITIRTTDSNCCSQFNHDSSIVPMPTNTMFLHDNIEYKVPVVALHQCKYI